MAKQDLRAQHCRPLQGAEHRLSEAELTGYLAQLTDWQVRGDELVREFRFANYYETMAFVNALAFVAHQQDHHPDLGVHYNRVLVRYSTHDVGGLSLNDVICAAKANALIAS